MTMNNVSLYQVTFKDGTVIENLTKEEVEKVCENKDWKYIDTMKGVELRKMMSKLAKGERLSDF